MNREIKYRVWHLKRQKMLSPVCIYIITKKVLCEGESGYMKFSEVEMLEYTGLKDKNGKDIYEGDIVTNMFAYYGNSRILQPSNVHYVILKNGAFICVQKNNYTERTELGGPIPTTKIETMNCYLIDKGITVIGNIYENAELLKQTK